MAEPIDVYLDQLGRTMLPIGIMAIIAIIC
jgi:hypothetical protein